MTTFYTAKFFSLFGLMLAGSVLSPLHAAGLPKDVAEAKSVQSGRMVIGLNVGWRFHFGDQGIAPSETGFDDSDWPKIDVPHTWNRVGGYDDAHRAQADTRQGVGWYRLHVRSARHDIGKRRFLDFAGASAVADVWVNGVHVGQHKGAFSRFRFDVTDAWKPGQDNVVAVRTDNSDPKDGGLTADVFPLKADFFVYGGLYRAVSLISRDQAGIDLLDYGGPGIYASATSLSPAMARVSVLTRLRNHGAQSRMLRLKAFVRDAAGKTVARTEQAVELGAGPMEISSQLAIAKPHRWDGTRDPYLYSITVALFDKGRQIDSVAQPLGLRSFRFDPDQGFFLNGKALKLRGVSRHQDVMGKGWALSPADHARDMAMIREMGANTIRMAHYEHADEWVAEADKAGMVTWEEIPFAETPSLNGGQGSSGAWANAETQLRELIRQKFNNPSVMIWAIGNEVDAAKGFGVKGEPPRPLALLRHLQEVAKAEDDTRSTAFTDCCEDLGMVQTGGEKLAGTADLIGYNRYYGWYMPQPLKAGDQLAVQMDKFHAKYPALPMSVSEYGAGGAISQHSDNAMAGALNFSGRPQPEEFESFVHEQSWPIIAARQYLFASWAWNMFDFASDLRSEGDSFDLNTKGLVTFDRKVKKDAFWYYKAQWNNEPMIWITGKAYRDRAYPVMEVKAYTNGVDAELTLNGQTLGRVRCPGGICRWPNVVLRAGSNRATVATTIAGRTIHDQAFWQGPAMELAGFHLLSGSLAGASVGGRRFGSDNFVSGGMPMLLNMGGFGGRTMPRREVAAPEPALFDFWREGEAFSYRLPLPDGRWKVVIWTFEPRPSASDAVMMSVAANGLTVVRPFNVKAAAGGALRGLAREFTVEVKGGQLTLDFAGQGGKAVVSAIEVVPKQAD